MTTPSLFPRSLPDLAVHPAVFSEHCQLLTLISTEDRSSPAFFLLHTTEDLCQLPQHCPAWKLTMVQPFRFGLACRRGSGAGRGPNPCRPPHAPLSVEHLGFPASPTTLPHRLPRNSASQVSVVLTICLTSGPLPLSSSFLPSRNPASDAFHLASQPKPHRGSNTSSSSA